MSTSSTARKVCWTAGRMLRFPASSSVYFAEMVSGSGTRQSLCISPLYRNVFGGVCVKMFALRFRRELLADLIAERFSVDRLALELRARGFHHHSHLFQRIGAGFGDRIG